MKEIRKRKEKSGREKNDTWKLTKEEIDRKKKKWKWREKIKGEKELVGDED